MALIELMIILATVLLFIVSDSKTIGIVVKDILNKYHITYYSISGNIFTGIKVINLEYNSTKVIDKIDIRWNPLALFDNKVYITKFELENINSPKVMEIIQSLPKSKNKKTKDIFFDIEVEDIKITANPLKYKNILFKNFDFESDKFFIDKNMQNINLKNIKFSLDTTLGNLGLHGRLYKNKLYLKRVSLVDIDTKEITKFIKSFPKNTKKSTKNKTESSFFLKLIKINKLFASLKRTTYKPITLEKTELSLSHVIINPMNSFSTRAKRAILKSNTTFADTKQIGFIKDSKLYTKGDIYIRDYLFRKYKLPLNKKDLKVLPIELELDKRGLWINAKNSPKKLLKLKSDFNVDIKSAIHKFSYIFMDKKIYIRSRAKGSMSYAKSFDIDNTVLIDIAKRGYTTYQGEAKIDKVISIPPDISKSLLKNLKAKYKGDKKELLVKIDSTRLKGKFITKGYKSAKLDLYTKKPIFLKKIVKNIPDSLNMLVDIKSNSFLDFKEFKKSKIGLKIISNKLKLVTTLNMSKPLKINFDIDIPKKSKLFRVNNKIKIGSLAKIKGSITFKKNHHLSIVAKNKDINFRSIYDYKSRDISRGIIYIGDEKIKFSGNLKDEVDISTTIHNLSKFSKTVMKYYNINLQNIAGSLYTHIKYRPYGKSSIFLKSKKLIYNTLQGDIDAKIYITQNSKVNIELKSKKLEIKTTKNSLQFHSVFAKLSIFKNHIIIHKYNFKFYNKYMSYFYSNKKSYLDYDSNNIFIKKLWLKDNILISGKFNFKKLFGNLNIVGRGFKFVNNEFDLLSDFNLNLEINKDKLFISGLVELLGNLITYKSIGVSEDSDIVILQNQSKKQNNILDNIKLNIQIRNKKPLHYKTDNIDIYFTNDITIIKDFYKEIKVLGTTTIDKGYYEKDNKKFYLDKSYIYFSGNPKKPMLDIKAIYNKEQYNIQIFITGTPDDPIINFNSDPYLTQKQILSLILFDTTGENSGSGNELYSLLGGTFAKELMKSLGINVDHLVLGQGIDEQISLEVGQKISKDVTVIYLHNNGKDGVKIKVDHGKHFETDILIYPQSSSIDFLYKSD